MTLFGKVTGRFMTAIVDSLDADQNPDLVPLTGKVNFTLNAARVVDMSGSEPVILSPTVITGVIDSEGYLSTPNPNGGVQYQGLWLPANNDPQQNPTNTQWNVTYDLQVPGTGKVATLPAHLLFLPSGSTVNLGAVIPPDPEKPMSKAQAEALLALAVRTINGISPDEDGNIDISAGGGGGAVDSVNGKTGAVTLVAADVGAAALEDVVQFVQNVDTALNTMNNNVNSKASATALSALEEEFDDFAESTELELTLRATQSSVDALSQGLATTNGNVSSTFQIAQSANTAAEAAQATANQAKGKADTALQPADRPYAGLNTVGVSRTIYIAHDAAVPTNLPAYTQIVRLP